MWIMELKIDPKTAVGSSLERAEWKAIHPTGGERYEYDTEEEAERMLRMCYPDHADIVRVREVE